MERYVVRVEVGADSFELHERFTLHVEIQRQFGIVLGPLKLLLDAELSTDQLSTIMCAHLDAQPIYVIDVPLGLRYTCHVDSMVWNRHQANRREITMSSKGGPERVS